MQVPTRTQLEAARARLELFQQLMTTIARLQKASK